MIVVHVHAVKLVGPLPTFTCSLKPACGRCRGSGRPCVIHIASVFYLQQVDHGISESDINSLVAHTSVAYSARARDHNRSTVSFHYCPPKRAAMDSSRKRKAANATPSSTDGSATKKIKLVVRVPFANILFFAMDRVPGLRAGGGRISASVRRRWWVVWWCCEREDQVRDDARERAWAALDLDFQPT
jgi:hypothetical protein